MVALSTALHVLQCGLHHITVTLVVLHSTLPCRCRDCTLKSSLTGAAAPSGMLGLDCAFKEVAVGTPGAKLELLTVDPAAQAAVGEWGHGSPCTVDVRRQPLNTLLCNGTDQLGECKHSSCLCGGCITCLTGGGPCCVSTHLTSLRYASFCGFVTGSAAALYPQLW